MCANRRRKPHIPIDLFLLQRLRVLLSQTFSGVSVPVKTPVNASLMSYWNLCHNNSAMLVAVGPSDSNTCICILKFWLWIYTATFWIEYYFQYLRSGFPALVIWIFFLNLFRCVFSERVQMELASSVQYHFWESVATRQYISRAYSGFRSQWFRTGGADSFAAPSRDYSLPRLGAHSDYPTRV